ncbi:flavin reductase family protein [Embleya scabrispora]|uniref:flavin reductase family protein n=1 Tax=Embleya scabrispora TaxID=159449 RepID=UPI0003A72204|nr:flavin reductase family protein [Embleya scabrispora]
MSSATSPSAGIDQARMRQVMGHFATGVTVVTAIHDGAPVGMACQSFTSLSLEPAYISIAPALTSTTYPRVRAAGRFVVNILAEDQQDVCRAMGRSGGDKFAGVDWVPAGNGAPGLAGAVAWIECDIAHELPGGDHVIVIGAVTALDLPRDTAPLMFHKGQYARLIAG